MRRNDPNEIVIKLRLKSNTAAVEITPEKRAPAITELLRRVGNLGELLSHIQVDIRTVDSETTKYDLDKE